MKKLRSVKVLTIPKHEMESFKLKEARRNGVEYKMEFFDVKDKNDLFKCFGKFILESNFDEIYVNIVKVQGSPKVAMVITPFKLQRKWK